MTKQWDKAIEDFSEAIRLGPKYPHFWRNRGIARFNIRDYANAITDFEGFSPAQPQRNLLRDLWLFRGPQKFGR